MIAAGACPATWWQQPAGRLQLGRGNRCLPLRRGLSDLGKQ
jgi:hypothetical protein